MFTPLIDEFAQKVKEQTNGEIIIEVFGNNILGDVDDILEQVSGGSVDINLGGVGNLGKFSPKYNAIVMPFLFESYDHANKTVVNDFLPWVRDDMEAKVTNVAVGDKVVMEPGLGCGHCEYCMTGRYNLCEDMKFMATPPYNGAFKKYMAYPARGCFKLPEGVSTLEGAMIEPLAVGMHAARRGEVDNSKVVLITGMGCIGLMTLLSCKAMNAQKIIVTDVFQNRLDKALELGADYAINVAEEDMIEKVKALTDGKGADIVFETAGRAQTAAQNVFAVRRGGVIVQVGTISDPVPYQFNELGKIEADIRSVFRYRNIFPLAIKLIEKGDINLKAVGPDIFDFEDVANAFDTAINRGNEVVKCILKF